MIRHGINTYKRVCACWPTFPIHRRRKNINKFHCKQQYYFIKNSYPTNRNDHKQLNVHFVEIILACSFKSSRSYFSFSMRILIQKTKGIMVDSRFAGERSSRTQNLKSQSYMLSQNLSFLVFDLFVQVVQLHFLIRCWGQTKN
jgi:hypothetical protein